MPVDKHDGDCWYSLEGCTIVRSVDEAVSKAVVLALANPLTTEPRFRKWARAEALARGWRELDREDLTEEPRWVCVLVGADDLGMVSCETVPGGRWQWWSSREDGESGIADNKEAAVDALIAAENARRAKGESPCLTHQPPWSRSP